MSNGDVDSFMDNIEMCGNIIRHSGFGWGQQRHNTHTPAHIKGWSYTNPARNFVIRNNIFDRGAYRLIHTVALDSSSCPRMEKNVYIQNSGASLGLYGSQTEAIELLFDENNVKNTVGDGDAKVILL
jgi:hypothetical protein